jgi:hypothetical protein
MKEISSKDSGSKELKYRNVYFSIWNILSLTIILALLNNLYFSEEQIIFMPQTMILFGTDIIFNTNNISWIIISINLIIFILTNIYSFFKIKGLFLTLTLIAWPIIPITVFNIYYMIKNKII